MRDNDGVDPGELSKPVGKWLDVKRRALFIGAVADGRTLEPQLITANGEPHLRKMLGINATAHLETWMAREKTEGAIRLAESAEQLSPPAYMKAAAEFIHDA
ncbi:hypothetical protein FQZ97_987660 [compost metagenome]